MMRANNAGSSDHVSEIRGPATWDDALLGPGRDRGSFSNCLPAACDGKSPPALFSIAIAVAIVLLSMALSLTRRVANNQYSPGFAARATQTKIDPNTASWASLVRIPGIGPARAEKLLAWRNGHLTKATPVVFKNLQDLRHIRSFGPKTLLNIARFLRFPTRRSAGGVTVVKSPDRASVPAP